MSTNLGEGWHIIRDKSERHAPALLPLVSLLRVVVACGGVPLVPQGWRVYRIVQP